MNPSATDLKRSEGRRANAVHRRDTVRDVSLSVSAVAHFFDQAPWFNISM
jgi:hypothetical protein